LKLTSRLDGVQVGREEAERREGGSKIEERKRW